MQREDLRRLSLLLPARVPVNVTQSQQQLGCRCIYELRVALAYNCDDMIMMVAAQPPTDREFGTVAPWARHPPPAAVGDHD